MTEHGRDDGSLLGGDIDRLEIALRVAGDDLDPERVTRMLGVRPAVAVRKGDPVERAGDALVQPTGLWIYELPASPEWELGDAIETLLDRLPPDPALWETLATRHSVEVLCGLFLHATNRGARLRPDTLARLVERRLTLGLDIYGPGREA